MIPQPFVASWPVAAVRIPKNLAPRLPNGSDFYWVIDESPNQDQSKLLRDLDPKQRRALTLFQQSGVITARDVAELFGYRPRTATLICQRWVENGFLEIVDPAKKSRCYKLRDTYEAILNEVE